MAQLTRTSEYDDGQFKVLSDTQRVTDGVVSNLVHEEMSASSQVLNPGRSVSERTFTQLTVVAHDGPTVRRQRLDVLCT